MVGPVQLLAEMAPLQGLDNVIVTGRVPYEEVPRYVSVFDVCLNPYILDEVAEHCSPLKLYEYVATGKPVVSVDMPEAHRFEGLVHIAADQDEFVRMVEQAVITDDGLAAQRMAQAEQHTWRSRFESANRALLETIERAMVDRS
jgi:glycosyltransferase involved in cell wall biosynthesis